jgi:hypothetical protein
MPKDKSDDDSDDSDVKPQKKKTEEPSDSDEESDISQKKVTSFDKKTGKFFKPSVVKTVEKKVGKLPVNRFKPYGKTIDKGKAKRF